MPASEGVLPPPLLRAEFIKRFTMEWYFSRKFVFFNTHEKSDTRSAYGAVTVCV